MKTDKIKNIINIILFTIAIICFSMSAYKRYIAGDKFTCVLAILIALLALKKLIDYIKALITLIKNNNK